MKRLLLATVATLALVVAPGPALARTAGDQGFLIISAGPLDAVRTVIAFGTIDGVGAEVVVSSSPGAVNVRWDFPQGTLFVTSTFTTVMELDPVTCLRTVTLTGTWRITGATDELAGTTGGGTFSGPNSTILSRGPDDRCVNPPVLRPLLLFEYEGSVGLANRAAA